MPRRSSGAHSRQKHPDARLRAETATVQVAQARHSWQEYERGTLKLLIFIVALAVLDYCAVTVAVSRAAPRRGASLHWQWGGAVARAKRLCR